MRQSMPPKTLQSDEFEVPSLHSGAKTKNSCFQPIPMALCSMPSSNLAGGYYVGGSPEYS